MIYLHILIRKLTIICRTTSSFPYCSSILIYISGVFNYFYRYSRCYNGLHYRWLVFFYIQNGISFMITFKSFISNFRSEEHTSELQSRENLVCRLLLEKKKKKHIKTYD